MEVGTGAVTDHQADRRLTLPEGEEDDGLDHEELEDGAVGAEQLPCGEVEEEESVKSQADGDVVDDGHIEVPTGDTVGQACCGWDQPCEGRLLPPPPCPQPAPNGLRLCPPARYNDPLEGGTGDGDTVGIGYRGVPASRPACHYRFTRSHGGPALSPLLMEDTREKLGLCWR